jgi:hypothetical protein
MDVEPTKEYCDYVHGRIGWYGGAADRYMRIYTSLRVALVLTGAILPFVAAQEWNVGAGVLGVLIAAATGLEGFFRPGEKWQLFRTTQLRLANELRKFEHATAGLAEEERDLRTPAYKGAYEAFFATTDEIMRGESEQFWRTTVEKKVPAEPEKKG